MKAAVFASLVSAAAAFTPSSQQSAKTTSSSLDATKADLEKIAEKANPVLKVRRRRLVEGGQVL